MIHLTKEEENILSAKDRYDIYSFAIEAADDGGFLNSFVFERAIYCYAAILLIEDEELQNEVRSKISENLITGWDYLIKNNIIQELQEKYHECLESIAEEAWIWFEEYSKYAHSARGILSFAEELMGNSVQDAANRLTTTIKDSNVNNIIDIANEWGMNRGALPAESSSENETLFE